MTYEALSNEKVNLRQLEEKLCLKFPNDYLSFLSQHNGISIENGYIKIKDVDEEVMMNVLFSSDSSLNRSLTLDFWNTEYRDDIPEGSAIIGDFQDGGFLLLIADGEYKGVYYYDHAYIFEESDDDCNTYLLAESFEVFMNKIEENL
jgi:SMI1 / KNR4 family protein